MSIHDGTRPKGAQDPLRHVVVAARAVSSMFIDAFLRARWSVAEVSPAPLGRSPSVAAGECSTGPLAPDMFRHPEPLRARAVAALTQPNPPGRSSNWVLARSETSAPARCPGTRTRPPAARDTRRWLSPRRVTKTVDTAKTRLTKP
jgi:hypothetical protein